MFGPYSVEYEGQRYFGNISLRELYIFNYDDNFYLVNVDGMTTHQISSQLATSIGRITYNSGYLISESEMLELSNLKLLVAEKDAQSEAKTECDSSSTCLKAEYPVTSIELLLSQECNLRCVYCFAEGGEYANKGIMSEDMAFRAIDWLFANSMSAEKLDICLFGGEALLNFSVIKKIVPYARGKAEKEGKQVSFQLITNGTLLNDEIISLLKEEKIVPVISVDGPPEYQNRQRPFKNGRGSYDCVYANVQKLREVFPNLTARATIYGDSNPLLVKQSLEQMGFSACYLVRAAPSLINAQDSKMQSEGLEEQTMNQMVAFNNVEIEQLFSAIRERTINRLCLPRLMFTLSGIVSAQKSHHGCWIGKSRVVITITGDVYPCACFVGMEDMRMGNIANYRSEGPNDYHRAVVDSLPECASCWARYYCGGGCFFRNKGYTGDLHRPVLLDCIERKELLQGLIHHYCQLGEDDKAYLKDILKVSIDNYHKD